MDEYDHYPDFTDMGFDENDDLVVPGWPKPRPRMEETTIITPRYSNWIYSLDYMESISEAEDIPITAFHMDEVETLLLVLVHPGLAR